MSDRPHVFWISADELICEALGCYGGFEGRGIGASPCLDRFAESAVRFERAYTASPVCLPSRTAVITGRFPHDTGAYSNLRPTPLSPTTPNIYNLHRSAGYRVGHIGKCHYLPTPYGLTTPRQTLEQPHDAPAFYRSLGIDHLRLQDDKHNSVWFYDDYSRELEAAGWLNSYRERAWSREHGKLFAFPGPAEWHPDAWVGREALSWIEGQTPGTPSFTWVSFSGPHYPVDPPREYLDRIDPKTVGVGRRDLRDFDGSTGAKIQAPGWHGTHPGRRTEGADQAPDGAQKNYDDDFWRRWRHHYFANVALIDEQIGLLLEAVSRHLGENVLVVFFADHGEMAGHHGFWGKNGCAYEENIRVPLLVRWPERTQADTRGELAMLTDLLPTTLATTGLRGPDGLPGRSLAEPQAESRLAFSEMDGLVAVTDGRWKLIQTFDLPEHGGAITELYDLANDPNEIVNLFGQPAACREISRMQQAILSHVVGDVLA